jgi:signal peptidase I
LNVEGPVYPPERSAAARTGIVALNLLTPGLGLIRTGRPRAGLLFVAAPIALSLALCMCAALSGPATFGGYVIIFGALLVGLVTVYVLSIAMSWRSSRTRLPLAWWSRWYALGAIWLVSGTVLQGTAELVHHFYKTFYSPSESMTPSLLLKDHFLADMHAGRQPRRGDIILFAADGGPRISRVAAIGGDTIEMRNGVPIVNGQASSHARLGVSGFPGFKGPQSALEIREQFPGERSPHVVLDDDAGLFSDTPPAKVPADSVFVLGDNRGRAADSRVPREDGGVGMIPVTAILGQPLFTYWSSDSARIGKAIGKR